LQARGDRVINDHIAFRSVDMRPLLRIFLFYGYEVQLDSSGLPFNFASSNKKLTAIWLRHPNATFPRLFISQVRLADIHPQAADLAQHYLAQSEDPLADLDLMDAVAVIDYLHTRGAKKMIVARVFSAASERAANKMARSVVDSPLVKSMVAGEMLNWGRLLMAIGKVGEPLNLENISLYIQDVCILEKGQEKTATTADFSADTLYIDIHVGMGEASAIAYGCDMHEAYATINKDKS
jgi:hypothetical protein